jgi:hypothetical protein
MLPFEDRYTRQRQLAEVGLSGQTRLEAVPCNLAAYEFASQEAELVAADYLRRAGVRVDKNAHVPAAAVDTTSSDPAAPSFQSTPHVPTGLFQFEGPSDVATGALVALHHIRAVLGVQMPLSPSLDQ